MAALLLLVVLTLFDHQVDAALGTNGKLVKRQSCDTADLPEVCRPILTHTIAGSAYSNPVFIDTYCSATCAEPLFNFFKNCDSDPINATRFDFFCSSNEAGNRCLPLVITHVLAPNTVSSACSNPIQETTCNTTCETAIEAARETLGCCLYSFAAVAAGPQFADTLFGLCSDDPTSFCVGGASGSALKFPVNVDPQCTDLVGDVDESCRSLLREHIFESAFDNLDQLCGDVCGPDIYEFGLECDKRTGVANATVLDVLCATNSDGRRCGALFEGFDKVNLTACDDIDGHMCPAECSAALQQGVEDFGCCLLSVLQLFSEGDFHILATLCDVDISGYCTGRFSGKPAPQLPAYDDCGFPELTLPDECRGYTSVDILFLQATSNPTEFKQEFCDGPCGKPVFDYFRKCDFVTGGHNATYLDFLCSENDSGALCAGIFSDRQLFEVIEYACNATTDRFCSQECSLALQQPSQMWSCCLFTLKSFDDNITYTEGIVEECQLEIKPEVCIGGLSGKPIAAPGQSTVVEPNTAICNRLLNAIPTECRDVSTFKAIKYFSHINADFPEQFCKSDCAKPVYDFLNVCDNKTNAAYIDFLCSRDKSTETLCFDIIMDNNFGTFRDVVCKDATDKQCSRECQLALQGFNEIYGCCLFTYSALATNVSFTNGLWAQCEADSVGLCIGGISNAVISAPGTEVDDAALATVISSTMPLVIAVATMVYMY